MRRKWVLSIFLISAALFFEANGWAQGCAMCKTALEQSAEGRALSRNFNYGILFLMGIPYAMFGAAGIVIFRKYRKKRNNS